MEIKDGKIFYYREIQKFGGKFPPSDYEALVKFHDAIFKADRARVALVKND